MALKSTTKVWRYMSFAKFVWMLQKKQLWLSNLRFLDDKWEGRGINFSQLHFVIASIEGREPSNATPDEYLHAFEKEINEVRDNTYVSCWNASKHESNALWRLYCSQSEGVAIQTTFGRLQESVEPLQVSEVKYDPIFDITKSLNDPLYEAGEILNLAMYKRPMFSYEQEVRVILKKHIADPNNPNRAISGTGLPWNPEEHIENIWIHPDAQSFFAECVTDIVKFLAPKLAHQIWWSKMNESPPF